VSQRRVEERPVRQIGAHDPRLGLKERRPAVRHSDRPAPHDLLGAHQLEVGAGLFEPVT
jgi:hypothetical protein